MEEDGKSGKVVCTAGGGKSVRENSGQLEICNQAGERGRGCERKRSKRMSGTREFSPLAVGISGAKPAFFLAWGVVIFIRGGVNLGLAIERMVAKTHQHLIIALDLSSHCNLADFQSGSVGISPG